MVLLEKGQKGAEHFQRGGSSYGERVSNLRLGEQERFADLRFADWHIYDICGFAISGQKNVMPNFGFYL